MESPSEIIIPSYFLLATSRNTLLSLTEFQDRIRDALSTDRFFLDSQTNLAKNFKINDGLLYHNDKLYVPDSEPIRTMILQMCHDSPLAGRLHF